MSLCDQCKRADNSCPIWHPCNDTEECVEYIPLEEDDDEMQVLREEH